MLHRIFYVQYSHPNHTKTLFTKKKKKKKANILCSLHPWSIVCIQFVTVWKVQSSPLHQKCFPSWHLVVCKQSPFGPWPGLSDSICREHNILETQTRKSILWWLHIQYMCKFITHSPFSSEAAQSLRVFLLLSFLQIYLILPEVWVLSLFSLALKELQILHRRWLISHLTLKTEAYPWRFCPQWAAEEQYLLI